MKKAKVILFLCALIAVLGLTACNNNVAEVRDGKTIDKAKIVDIYKANTATFDLKAGESLFVLFKGDGTMNDFTFRGPTGSKIDYVIYNADKSFNSKVTDADDYYHDTNETEQVYVQFIIKTAGEYSYQVD